MMLVKAERLHVSGIGRAMQLSAATALALVLAASQSVAQSIVADGAVNPAPPAGGLWTAQDIRIGNGAAGSVTASGGATIEARSTTVGNGSGGSGTLVLTGEGTTLENEVGLHVGLFGDGELQVLDGAKAFVGSMIVLGSEDGSFGRLVVSGQDSSIQALPGSAVQPYLWIGERYGAGAMRIELGGIVRTGWALIDTGSVTVDGAGSLWETEYLSLVDDDSVLTISAGGRVTSNGISIGDFRAASVSVDGATSRLESDAAVVIGYAEGSSGRLTLSNGATAVFDDYLSIGEYGSGILVVESGAILTSDSAYLGFERHANGTASISGEGSRWDSGQFVLGTYDDTQGTLVVSDGGTASAGREGEFLLGYMDNASGTIAIGAVAGEEARVAGVIEGARLVFGEGSGHLVFNHTGNPDGSTHVFGTAIMGGNGSVSGTIEHLAGRTVLTGDSSAFGGTTWVTGGTLLVGDAAGNGSLGGIVNVGAGGTVGGGGSIGGVVQVFDGGTLSGRAGSTLAVGSDLTLSSGSVISVALGTPSSAALFDVAGDLTLDGSLNVSDAGGFGAGVYRLFDYGGTLTDNGLDIGTAPDGIDADDLTVQTAVAGRVNLISSAGVDLGFWDGGDTNLHDNGLVDGGSGTWRTDGRNWTSEGGIANGPFRPNPTYAVFQGRAGTVSVDDGAGALGVVGMQFVTDSYRIEGDAIALEGADGQSVIRVGDGTAAGASTTATIASRLTGASSLVKDDLGTLILTGVNTYEGDTLVRSGTLVGNASSIRGDIGNAGTVVFDQSDAASFAGDISGLGGTAGEMILRGGGVLTIEGVSTLGWTVADGTLVSASTRFTGDLDIASGAGFVFDQADDGSYAGVLSGAGDLAYTGGGAVTLTGDSSGFAGLSTVTGSTLVVNETLGGSAMIGEGGILAGTGTIGSGTGSLVTLASGGTLAPGNSIGRLTVNGDLVLASGSRFEVEMAPGGTDSDLVAVTGTATIGGGTVAHIGMTGAYDPTATHTILSADGGLAAGSAFDDVTSDFAFLDPTLGYGANNITLTLSRNDVDFADVAVTRNQIATAGGLEGLSFGNDLYDVVVQLDEATARAAFDQLSGEIHGSVVTSLVEDGRYVRNTANDRIRAAFGDVGASATPVLAYGPDGPALAPADGNHLGMSAWGSAYGSWGSTDGDGNAAAIDRSTGGVLVGADAFVTDQLRLGLLAGTSRSSVDLDARASSADIDSYHLGLYGGIQWQMPEGAVSLRGGLAYSWHDIETARTIGFIGFTDSLTADYDANTFQAFGELGYGIETEVARFEPFVNLAHVNVRTNGFAESGGAAALSAGRGSNGVTFTTLGFRAQTAIDPGQTNTRLNGMIGWRHAFGDTMPESTHAFAGSDAFTVAGSPIGPDALVLDAGLDLDLIPDARLGLSYQGQFASGAQDHGFRANLDVRF